jgi:hypothetical protein
VPIVDIGESDPAKRKTAPQGGLSEIRHQNWSRSDSRNLLLPAPPREKTSAVSRACQVCGQLGHVSNFIQTPHSNLRKQDSSKHQSQAPKRFDSTLKIFVDRASSNRTEQASGEGTYMRFQYAPLKSKPTMFQPINPCPVCGAETTLAEIEPHPLHANFEIHGYLCDRCGPTKSLVVLRSPPLQPMM